MDTSRYILRNIFISITEEQGSEERKKYMQMIDRLPKPHDLIIMSTKVVTHCGYAGDKMSVNRVSIIIALHPE
jgi:hypothetical protein